MKLSKGYKESLDFLLSYFVLDYDFQYVILSILNICLCYLMDAFSGCSLIQLKK